ncbi:hypothetical protein OHA40_26765 [Nocardia sp. NBC_00508]|uniref:hypothetical protein n=1 Tax=Nocardia sp. NBC_00508 TaxID=2975992 RepID=UPI002E80F1B0|nr:hypothetical protein [Nocardia sp. NBC_00508]WUD65214.1 hypothetical protein OHA40_26765 [Nocardia sp. NBC_00508]
MAVGTFSYQNASGYPGEIENPDEYRTYNIDIGKGSVDNRTNATVRLYTRRDGQGDSDYLNPNSSTYTDKSYQSCVFTT